MYNSAIHCWNIIVNHCCQKSFKWLPLSPAQRLAKRGETELGVWRCRGDVGKGGKCRSPYSLFSFPTFHTHFIIFTPSPLNYQPMVMAARKRLLQRRERVYSLPVGTAHLQQWNAGVCFQESLLNTFRAVWRMYCTLFCRLVYKALSFFGLSNLFAVFANTETQ